MSLVVVLATMTLIGLASSTPVISEASQGVRIPIDHDHFLLVLLLNRRDFPAQVEHAEEVDWRGEGAREKRISSMSVVNSMDVLRERYLLELARRKALEDQAAIGGDHGGFAKGKRSSDLLLASSAYRPPRKKPVGQRLFFQDE